MRKYLTVIFIIFILMNSTVQSVSAAVFDVQATNIKDQNKPNGLSQVYKVVVPTSLAFTIDPYEITEEGSKILSPDYYIINKSSVPVNVDVSIKIAAKEGIDLYIKESRGAVNNKNYNKQIWFGLVKAKQNFTEDYYRPLLDPYGNQIFAYDGFYSRYASMSKSQIASLSEESNKVDDRKLNEDLTKTENNKEQVPEQGNGSITIPNPEHTPDDINIIETNGSNHNVSPSENGNITDTSQVVSGAAIIAMDNDATTVASPDVAIPEVINESELDAIADSACLVADGDVTSEQMTFSPVNEGELATIMPMAVSNGAISTEMPEAVIEGTADNISLEPVSEGAVDISPESVSEGTINAVIPEVVSEGTINAVIPEVVSGEAINASMPEVVSGGAINSLIPEVVSGGAISSLIPEVVSGGAISSDKKSNPAEKADKISTDRNNSANQNIDEISDISEKQIIVGTPINYWDTQKVKGFYGILKLLNEKSKNVFTVGNEFSTIRFTLDKAEAYEIDQSMLLTGAVAKNGHGVATFRFIGEVNNRANWAKADVKATINYSFSSAEPALNEISTSEEGNNKEDSSEDKRITLDTDYQEMNNDNISKETPITSDDIKAEMLQTDDSIKEDGNEASSGG